MKVTELMQTASCGQTSWPDMNIKARPPIHLD
jgi:hypothetical protein